MESVIHKQDKFDQLKKKKDIFSQLNINITVKYYNDEMNLTYYPLFSKPVYKVFLLTVMQSLSTMYLHRKISTMYLFCSGCIVKNFVAIEE